MAIALAVIGCFRDSTSPRVFRPAAFSLAPTFSTRAAKVVEFDHVRVVLYRSSGAVALDTCVVFPDTSDQISLGLSVPLSGATGSETFSVTLAMMEGTDTVFRGGPTPVTVSLGVTATQAPIALRYTGVGANAASVAITVKDTCLFFADSVVLTAVARDSAGQPIPGTPIEWETADSTRVRIPNAASGKIVALAQRGVARVIAETPTGLADTSRVTVQPAPAALSVVSGGGQSAPIGTTLAQPVVLRAKAADSLGVRGVTVNFTVAGGGTVLKASDTTNANGDVSVAWTLGATLGAQSITAKVASAPSITTTVTATGVAGAPKKLAFQVQPSSGAAGVALSPAVQVVAQDTFGNIVPGYTDLVTVWIGTNPGGATLGGTLTVRAVAGVATFADLTLSQLGTGYTLVAAADGVTAATSNGFNITGGVPTQLAFVQQPSNTMAGAVIAPPITVAIRDVNANLVTTATNAVTLALGTNPGGGTLSGTLTVPAVGGVATFNGLSIDNIGTGYTLVASASGLTPATSAAFSILAALNANAWINPAGGDWSVATNWSKGTVPVATDTVQIKQSGTYTVTVDGNATFARLDVGAPSGTQTVSVATGTLTAGNGAFGANTVLDLSGTGTLGGAGTLTLAGAFNWTGGNISGGGGGIRVQPGGILSIAPASQVKFENYTLEVAGTGTWTGAAQLYGGQAILRVASGGTLDVQGDPSLAFNAYWAWAPRLNVVGTLTRTTSTGVAVIGGPLNDSGTVSIQSGTLQLTAGGTSTGAYDVAAGDTLDFSGGTHALLSGSDITGAGTVKFSGGTVNAGGGYGVPGLSLIDGGTANFNTVSGSTGALTVVAGTLGGTDTLSVTGPMSWAGGNLSGANGKVRAGAALSIAPASQVKFENYTLEVAGTGTWTGAAQLYGGQAILRVASGGTLDVQGDPSLAFNAYWAWAPRLNVVGTLTRTTSTGVAVIGGPLNDSGTVSLQTGTLRLAGGGMSSGAYQVVDASALDFSGGTHTLGATSRIAGYGTVSFSGGTANIDGTYAVGGPALVAGGTANFNNLKDTTGSLTVSSGTLGGSGLLVVIGPMSWTGGNLNGSAGTVRVFPGGTLSIAPAAGVLFQNYTVELAGNGTWTGSAAIAASNAVLRITGLLDIRGDPSLNNNGYYPNPPAVNVIGSLTRTSSAGVATIGGPLNDSGTVSVQTGTLRLAGGGSGGMGFAVQPGATLDLAGGTWTVGTNMAWSFSGSLKVSGGSLVINDRVSVGEDFATAGSGVLVMGASNDSLGVRRNVTFGGGSSAGTLSQGMITVGRNFAQTGAGAVFAPTGTAVWLIGDTAFQTVQLADPISSSFYDLHLSPTAWDTVRLLSDVTVRNTLSSGGFAEVLSAATQRLKIDGTLDMTMDGDRLGLVHPFALELQNPPVLGSGYYNTALSPDTLVFLGAGGFNLPTGATIQYNSVRLAAASPITWSCSECADVYGDMVIGGPGATYGGLQIAYGANLWIDGKLKTEGQGVLIMAGAYSTVSVGDSAIFAGGSTAGLLQEGALQLYGDLHATSAPGAFAPGGNHLTDFLGDNPQTAYFATPDTTVTGSHFNMLYVSNYNYGLQFLSSAQALADVNIVGETGLPISGHSGDSLTVFGPLALAGVRFDSLSLVAKLPQWATASLTSVTFGDYDPSVTEFYFEQPGDSMTVVSFDNITFLTDLPTGSAGWHFVANDADGLAPWLRVNLYATWPPPSYNEKVDARNGAIVGTAF